MATATITAKGQVTLPSEVRKRLNLKPGDPIDFVFEPDGKLVVRTKRKPFERLEGILKSPYDRPLTLKEIDAAIGSHHAEENERITREYGEIEK